MFRHICGSNMSVCVLLDKADGVLDNIVRTDRGLGLGNFGGEGVCSLAA